MKLKILLTDSDILVRSLLKKNFEENFDAEVFDFDKIAPAIECLNNDPGINIIITKNASDTENFASVYLNYLYDHTIKTPLIVIGEFEHTYKKYALVSGKLRAEEINRLILKALNLKKEDFAFLKLPDYIAYPVSYFYLMKSTPVDLFIKLTKNGSDEFVKRFNENDNFTRENLSKYEELGLKDFYIFKDDSSKLMNALLSQTLLELKNAPEDKKVAIVSNTFSISADMMRKVGITPEAKLIADQTISQIVSQVSKGDKLGEMLRRILDDEFSYSYKRSYLISLLAATVMPRLDWVSGEQLQVILNKLTMVAYFHDIYLEEEQLLKVMTNDEYKLVQPKLNYNQRELVLNHANKAALLLQSYPKLPNGIDLIVKQHHGVSNGVGFPETYSASLSPLAIVFVVLEDCAHLILKDEKNIKIGEIVKVLADKYTLPSYRKIVTELGNLNKPSK